MSYSLYTIAKTTYRAGVPRRFDQSAFAGQTALSRLIFHCKAVLI